MLGSTTSRRYTDRSIRPDHPKAADFAKRYPKASFFGADGYHHQLACNSWNSAGAGTRPRNATGLDGFELLLRRSEDHAAILERAAEAGVIAEQQGDSAVLHDPWGNSVTLHRTML